MVVVSEHNHDGSEVLTGINDVDGSQVGCSIGKEKNGPNDNDSDINDGLNQVGPDPVTMNDRTSLHTPV